MISHDNFFIFRQSRLSPIKNLFLTTHFLASLQKVAASSKIIQQKLKVYHMTSKDVARPKGCRMRTWWITWFVPKSELFLSIKNKSDAVRRFNLWYRSWNTKFLRYPQGTVWSKSIFHFPSRKVRVSSFNNLYPS